MALYKPIRLSNGITMSYHRITQVDVATNAHMLIHINSYIDQQGREDEKAAYANNEPVDSYIIGFEFLAPYDEAGAPIKGMYEYLKTLSEFEGAQDVFEEGQS